MAFHNDLGKRGEQLAVKFLEKDGYEILARNWIFKKSEVDIFAIRNGVLAVIEVKTRSSIVFGSPQSTVDSKKIKLLVMAVNAFISQRDLNCEVRFDIIAIHNDKGKLLLEHLVDAFYHF